MSQIRRRQLLWAASAMLGAPTFTSIAQTPQSARLGYLDSGSPTSKGSRNWMGGVFLQTLRELGWEEGRNLTIESRFADGRPERLADYARDLVQRKVQIIVVSSNREAHAVLRETRSVPIITMSANDPVGAGLAKSLASPGGTVTGLMYTDTSLFARLLQLLREILPSLQRVGTLEAQDPDSPGQVSYTKASDAAAREMGVTLHRFVVTKPDDIAVSLAGLKRERVEAFYSHFRGALATAAGQVREFAANNKIPDVYTFTVAVTDGGFMSYASSRSEIAVRAAKLVDKILRGAKPANLPFEYPTRYELVINLKSAKERGISVPQSILLRADQVIE